MNYSIDGPRPNYHDAPESLPYDNSHNAPETVPYVAPLQHNEKPLDAVNPKIMEVGIGSRRRLGDMRASKFWITLAIVCALIIAATVGGAVGGSLAVRKDRDSSSPSSASSSANATGASSTSSGGSSNTQTSTTTLLISSPTTFPAPSKNCQNGTTYNSLFQTGENGAVPPGAGLTFTRLCGQNADLHNIGSAFVYSFDDCIEICAGINFWPGNKRCTGVIYRPEGKGKPVNCWASNQTSLTGERSDLFTALLQ
ncbi:hypothetical protein BKA65DRAFT_538617 [Rhexocercosporidium sp. MPI-PUGE-AT-0058]|nr:hypothetical protein BKA65DRAFT_538617 [Rhexocercosporidium sp. MPI-PUGE-AT-0058]